VAIAGRPASVILTRATWIVRAPASTRSAVAVYRISNFDGHIETLRRFKEVASG
jgi:hypothetical protein